MVMATAAAPSGADQQPREAEVDGEANALHERLVAYVRAVGGGAEARSGVWGEHSYARARDVGSAAGDARELLATRGAPDAEPLDVERPPPPPPAPLPDDEADDDADADGDDDEWEARVTGAAPSAAHARLAHAALDALRRLRLARLARAPLAAAARAEARRLRLALAPLWLAGGPPASRPPAWLHAALQQAPRGPRRLYEALLSQLHRSAPRLAERLSAASLPPAAPDPLAVVGPPATAADDAPLLLWVSVGGAGARWPRRLGALLPLRELRAAGDAEAAPAPWCAAAAGAARGALSEALANAGARRVLLGGFGAGAALAAWLAGAGAAVCGLVLLAPPLLTAEGGDWLRGVRVPALLVTGAGAAQSWRGAAGDAAAGGARRLLLVAGADDALRLPAAQRRRLRLPQHALDAAVAEEVARWAAEAADAEPDEAEARGAAADAPSPPRAFEAVVSRVSGGTPLALLPPRRRSPELERRSPPPPSRSPLPTAADILHMPIVFADDERAERRVTVTSGAPRFARVVVASRGASASASAASAPSVRRRGRPQREAPLLLRRAPPR